MSMDNIIQLDISIQDRTTERASLDVPLVLAYHTAWTDRVREYSDTDEMLDDGFDAEDDAHVLDIVSSIKRQENAPRLVKVGRRATPITQVVHFVPTVTAEGHKYTWTAGPHAGEYVVPASATVKTIVEAVAPLMDAYSEFTATDDDTKVVLTNGTAGSVLPIKAGAGWKLTDASADTTLDDDLAAVVAEDDDWYALLTDTNSAASILLGAAFIEARRKVFLTQSADAAIYDPSSEVDVAFLLQAASYMRTYGVWHNSIGGTEYVAAAWAGTSLHFQPGSETWAFKSPVGPTFDKLSQGQENAILAKNWNTFTRVGGNNIIYDSASGGGRYLDIVRFVDWLYSEIRAAVFGMFVNNPKVPYTDDGAEAMRSTVAGVLTRGQRAGGLAADPAPIVTVPRVATIDPSIRATRILPDIDWSATLAGALHGVRIRGKVSV